MNDPSNIDDLSARYGYDPDALPPEDDDPGPGALDYTPRVSKVDLGLLAHLDQLKQRLTKANAGAEELKKAIKAIEATAVEQMMEEEQDKGVPISTERKASVRLDTWPKWETDDRAARNAAFRAEGGQWAELVQTSINSQTLRAFLLELERISLDDGGPGLPDCIPDGVRQVLGTSDTYGITFSALDSPARKRPNRATRTGASRADAAPDRL